MRPTCLLFPNMRLRGHNLDFRGCDKGTFATVDVFFPRVRSSVLRISALSAAE